MRIEPATMADCDEVCALDRTVTGPHDRGDVLREWIHRSECLVARTDSGLLVGFAADAYHLVTELVQSPQAKEMLEGLVAQNNASGPRTSAWHLVLGQQERAWAVLRQVAGTATRAIIGLVVIFAGTYTVLVDRGRWYRWFEQYGPIPRRCSPVHAMRSSRPVAGCSSGSAAPDWCRRSSQR